MLSALMSLYDPLGFLAPCLMEGKSILQQLCKLELGWDEPASDEVVKKWSKRENSLGELHQVTVPRSYNEGSHPVTNVRLDHFADASDKGYGCCLFIQLSHGDTVSPRVLLIGKSRVAPIKLHTIPRMELQAAMTCARIGRLVNSQLQYKGVPVENHYWTDSRVVLGYVNNEARRFKVFEANRIQEIRNLTEPEQWGHVDTAHNPADHASRGMTPEKLQRSNWFTGPTILLRKYVEPISEDLPGIKSSSVPTTEHDSASVKTTTENLDVSSHLERFSEWDRMLRGVTEIVRIQGRRKGMDDSEHAAKQTALQSIYKTEQEATYSQELKLLNEGKPVTASSPLERLTPLWMNKV